LCNKFWTPSEVLYFYFIPTSLLQNYESGVHESWHNSNCQGQWSGYM
jgi:hypothetical protein